ncbi:MAG: glycoside hydrolase family 16 protein [Saprospiraceae bacterium]|nr:glycoside hydrolase family 16 protein [Saprospiraceae bacterium]
MKQLFFFILWSTSHLAAQDSLIVVEKSGLDICSKGTWNLIWSDEFEGHALDRTKWFSYFPFTKDGSDSCAACRGLVGDEFLSDSNLIVQNGVLSIEARKEKASWFGKDFDYTSGNIFSMQGFKYGRFEIRCKLPEGKGFWPSFWTAGDGVIEEIDVFEAKGHIQTQLQTNYHHCYNRSGCQQPKWHWTSDQEDWNTYAIEWDPFFIRWYVNKRLVRTLPGYKNLKNNRPANHCILRKGNYVPIDAFPKNKHRIISGLGVGGPFGGRISSKTKFPSRMEIDYIRIYQRTDSE